MFHNYLTLSRESTIQISIFICYITTLGEHTEIEQMFSTEWQVVDEKLIVYLWWTKKWK